MKFSYTYVKDMASGSKGTLVFRIIDWSINSTLLCLARVGKTSISLRFVNNVFNASQMSTVDASFLAKKVQVGERSVNLNIWDTAG